MRVFGRHVATWKIQHDHRRMEEEQMARANTAHEQLALRLLAQMVSTRLNEDRSVERQRQIVELAFSYADTFLDVREERRSQQQ